MKSSKLLLLPIFLLLFVSMKCNKTPAKKPTDWHTDYEKLNQNPYSLQLAYKGLSMLFPKAAITTLKETYRLNNLGYELRKNKAQSLIVIITRSMYFNPGEIDSMVSFVQAGHQVLLVSNTFDEKLLNRLQVSQTQNEDRIDSLQKIFVNNFNQQPEGFNFKFKDESIQQQFNKLDTDNVYFSVLGTNQNLHPNFIEFHSGAGRLLLHTAPMAFSNYFLVQGNNREYLRNVFGYVNDSISNIYFIAMNERHASNTNLSAILKIPTIRTAFWLCLLTLLIYILFEMKRRQKIIPIIKPNENTSVAFTETIGRLYYNNKNHGNLAEKMIQHFLEFVRSNYYLNTNILDAEFVKLLSAKSDIDIAKTDALIYNIKMVHDGLPVDEAFLFALYTQIQEFYNGK